MRIVSVAVSLSLAVVAMLSAGCAGPSSTAAPEPEAAQPAQPAAAAKPASPTADERKGWQKELQQKQRELTYARAEMTTQDLDRQLRLIGAEQALAKADAGKEKAGRSLTLFLEQERPAALAERQLNIDQMIYRAEEAKDELAELEAMYDKDEFAKTTKELVLKRSRRQLEVADRRLKLARDEQQLEAAHRLPQRERDLRQELQEAETGHRRAAMELEKARLEAELAVRKAKDRIADLDRDIAELQKKLGPGS